MTHIANTHGRLKLIHLSIAAYIGNFFFAVDTKVLLVI